MAMRRMAVAMTGDRIASFVVPAIPATAVNALLHR
jgi:hypothetical protein